jgi:outer membrane protein assembly factor BamA
LYTTGTYLKQKNSQVSQDTIIRKFYVKVDFWWRWFRRRAVYQCIKLAQDRIELRDSVNMVQ